MSGITRIGRGALAVVALTVGLAALPASAQPGHHGGDGGGFLAHLGAVKDKLNLDTSQQGLWDQAVAAGKSAHEAARARRATVHQVIAEEAAKPAGVAPDLARIAATTDQVQDANAAGRRAARDPWLKLYATFKPEQVAVVKAMLSQRLARMDSMQERMKERFGRRQG